MHEGNIFVWSGKSFRHMKITVILIYETEHGAYGPGFMISDLFLRFNKT